MEKQLFDSRTQFQALLLECFSHARLTLQMFDPDYAWWQLGHSKTDALLRHFLQHKGRLQLVAHSNAHLERNEPRFLKLLEDYSHQIECRLTSRSIRTLTDSFCVADGVHIVRRYHADISAAKQILMHLRQPKPVWSVMRLSGPKPSRACDQARLD